jgi:hypothetical protein
VFSTLCKNNTFLTNCTHLITVCHWKILYIATWSSLTHYIMGWNCPLKEDSRSLAFMWPQLTVDREDLL